MWYRLAKEEKEKLKLGGQEFHGIDIFVEFLKGDTRTKTNEEGKTWSRVMTAAYGRISKTKGADGMCIDIYVGEDLESNKVFIVDQVDKEGSFDEHKCLLGCFSLNDAKETYSSNYPKNFKVGKITEYTIQEFKKWIESADKSKPANEL